MKPDAVLQGFCLLVVLLLAPGAPAQVQMEPPAPNPGPFIRDVQTGCLLDYHFLSPRPHTWRRDYSLLSGWEIDRRGGTFAFDPDGIFPAGFGFHINWFKLVDTNADAAVSIKHLIARQDKGRLTLEFRFKLPQLMDGTSWQLLDLQQPAVSLTTAAGKLVLESGSGRTALEELQTGAEYGVRVVADIDTKTADVYVNGKLEAERARFTSPVNTIDAVRVQTGRSAVGEMFIGPVTIYKGYAARETFVSAATRSVPAGWRIESGSGSVEQFECGTKPDIFSLKLRGKGKRPGIAATDFAKISGPVVIKYRFLLPAKQNGTAIHLLSGKSPVITIGTTNGDLCAIGQEQPVLLASNYRSNLWYMVKIIARPEQESADVFLNGKQVASNLSIKSLPLSRLRFSVPAQMWVDDVEVYPWHDYPKDYVPEPKAVSSDFLVGIQSCDLWREGRSYAGWEYVYPYGVVREPYLGWYDEGNPEETDGETKWQVEHGISFQMHCWYRPNSAMNQPIKDAVCDQAIVDGLFNSRYGQMKKFAIMFVVEGACKTTLDDFQNNILPYWIEYFFKDPRYLKIDNKPLVTIYMLNNLISYVGGIDNCRALIQSLRNETRKAGFADVIVCAEHRGTDRKLLQTMKEASIDYFYAYMFSTPKIDVQRDKLQRQAKASAEVALNMIPCISVGTDSQGWSWNTNTPSQSVVSLGSRRFHAQLAR